MPFAYGDIYTSSLSDNDQSLTTPSRLPTRHSSISISSKHFFITSLLLFLATALQFSFNPTAFQLTSSPSIISSSELDTFTSFTYDIVYILNNTLSPLMLLAFTVGMAGTLCRGLELVVAAAAFKGKQ